MRLKHISLQHFRNIGFASLDLDGDRQFFTGRNGQGKTNLLEAIGYFTALRSHRTADQRDLLKRGEKEAAVACTFEHETLGETVVEVRIGVGYRSVRVDGEPVRRLVELIGRFPSVVFSSDDIQLVRGSPAGRRRFLDMVLAAADPEYLISLQRYHSALGIRNKALKRQASTAELKAFEVVLAGAAARVVTKRRKDVRVLGERLAEQYALISANAGDRGELVYEPDLDFDEPEDFCRVWREQETRDKILGTTRHGPHRDDIQFRLDGEPARHYASEGQQRSLVLALRHAQAAFHTGAWQIRPLILADDIIGELDPVRREAFWRTLGPGSQILATGTVPPGDRKSIVWQSFLVENGKFVRDLPV